MGSSSGGLTYQSVFYWSIIQYGEDKRTTKQTQHGVIRDKELVVIPIGPPEGKQEPKDIEFECDIGNYKQTMRSLVSRTELGFILTQKNFDELLKMSKVESLIENDQSALRELQAKKADLEVLELNQGSLAAADASTLKTTTRSINKAVENIERYTEEIFSAYRQMVNVRALKFDNFVSRNCLTPVPHEVEEVQVYKEAFHVESDGSKGSRYSEKDGEENENRTNGIGWVFENKWQWVKKNVTREIGKTLESFRSCRRSHIKEELPEFGYAEAQWRYMMENINCPLDVDVSDFNDMIDQVGSVMYLLPSILDDPNPEIYGKLAHISRKDRSFFPIEVCQMLFYAMPVRVQELWKIDNPKLRFPVDRALAVKELQRHLETYRKEKKLAKQGANKGGPNSQGGRQDQGGGSRSNGGSRQSGGGSPRKKKMCDRCDQKGESDRIKFSHWSDKCDKYHPNLQAKVPKHEQRQLHAMNQETETPLSTSKKKRKKKKQKTKKSKKQRLEALLAESDDDDSSSSAGSDSS
mmetsp:Transcript_3094/g.4529  ORF Transcript_3094/g.4529 Transcript_3094/m.4529 type:complete len:523 (+) Transcript_3094:3517-5085(+)